jgi:hypothetical protein
MLIVFRLIKVDQFFNQIMDIGHIKIQNDNLSLQVHNALRRDERNLILNLFCCFLFFR